MIKLFIFDSVEDAREFEKAEKDIVLDAVSISTDRLKEMADSPAEERPVRHYKKNKQLQPQGSGDDCFCGRPAGHRGIHRGAKFKKQGERRDGATPGTRIEVKTADDSDEKPVLSCHICEEDHMTRDCPDFGSTVTSYREKGMDSIQIAAKLKIRLKDIPID